MPEDFHLLPKVRDSLSYIYIEHAVIERRDGALLVLQQTGKTPIPAANLCLLMLGPGTTVTHAAIKLITESGASVLWTGEDMLHYYAQGMGETRRAAHLIRQAQWVSDPQLRLKVVRRMYEIRFGHPLETDLTLEQIRGMEGVRVRTLYQRMSKEYGVEWKGRNYDPKKWDWADPVNRALSASNALLYGVCHAAIVAGGYSPALGFLHTGYHLAFVHDIADLYKSEFTIPVAFQVAAESEVDVEKRTREACRERFREGKLLQRILPDIDALLEIEDEPEVEPIEIAYMAPWWTPEMAEGEGE